LKHQIVQVANNPVCLTAVEYDLLKVLVFNAGRLLTQRRLTQEVWGERNEESALPLLRTTMATLRQKLDSDRSHPGHIATEPGVGYRLRIATSN
jgi:two-component system KDP operon response regulator KdpE